jgi:hypothetical protein
MPSVENPNKGEHAYQIGSPCRQSRQSIGLAAYVQLQWIACRHGVGGRFLSKLALARLCEGQERSRNPLHTPSPYHCLTLRHMAGLLLPCRLRHSVVNVDINGCRELFLCACGLM